MKNENYRLIYEDYYKFKIPKGWDVHHLDYNHKNNTPTNLLALPRELHQHLHETYNNFCRCTPCEIQVHTGQVCNRTLYQEVLLEYLQTVEDCTVYMNLREGVKGYGAPV